MKSIKPPCIGRCSCTLGDDVCRGCFRTADEVRDWNGYTQEQKRQVIKMAVARRVSDAAIKYIKTNKE